MRHTDTETILNDLLCARSLPYRAEVHEQLPSTNTFLREALLTVGTSVHGKVVWAKMQQAGKGSRGRTFFSPPTGLYASVLLPPASDALLVTCAAAVAVSDAIASEFRVQTDIKWVNDLYLSGRKVCGILCEGVSVGSTLSGMILGFGVNLAPPPNGFPSEIADRAGALLSEMPDERRCATLLTEILANLHRHLSDPTHAYMQTYRARNLVCGKQVRYHVGETDTDARVLDITPRGTLCLQLPSGEIREAAFGEVCLDLPTPSHALKSDPSL